jgi:hypothetical protein
MYIKQSPEIKTADSLHKKRPLLEAIREKCRDCSGGSLAEIRYCPVTKCALWPYRMGSNPFAQARGRSFSEKNPAVCGDFSERTATGAVVFSERNNCTDFENDHEQTNISILGG